MYLDILYC